MKSFHSSLLILKNSFFRSLKLFEECFLDLLRFRNKIYKQQNMKRILKRCNLWNVVSLLLHHHLQGYFFNVPLGVNSHWAMCMNKRFFSIADKSYDVSVLRFIKIPALEALEKVQLCTLVYESSQQIMANNIGCFILKSVVIASIALSYTSECQSWSGKKEMSLIKMNPKSNKFIYFYHSLPPLNPIPHNVSTKKW